MPISALSHADLLQINGALQRLYAETNPALLPRLILEELGALVPNEHCSYNEIVLAEHRAFVVMQPDVPRVFELFEAFETHLPEHVILRHWHATGNEDIVKWTDFLTQRQCEQLPIHRDFFRHVDTRYQMGVRLSTAGSPCDITLGINRLAKDFSERDRELLGLLRPHLMQARKNAWAFAEATPAALQGERAHQELRKVAKVQLDARGGVIDPNPEAARILRATFPDEAFPSQGLPDMVLRWVRMRQETWNAEGIGVAAPPWTHLGPAGRLVLHLSMQDDGRATLLVSLDPSVPIPHSASVALSNREREVLFWIREGKTNEAIGTILAISPRTVQKHVERILAKLGVENRHAAARMAARDGCSDAPAGQGSPQLPKR